MSCRLKWLTVPLLITLLLPLETARATADEGDLESGRRYTRMFFAENTSPIWDKMTARMHDALGSEGALLAFRRQVVTQLGAEIGVIEERIDHVQGYRAYIRQSRFEKVDNPIVVAWTFDDKDRIAGFFIRPQQQAAASQYLDYETEAELVLPFAGEWYVFWGGRDIEDNYHAVARDQRFAYDFVIVKDRRSHSDDGSRNEHYHCWGEPILAPAAGTIVSVVADLPDNPPGTMDARNPPGNHVVIDLGNDEYALLAHMQESSIAVSAGDSVGAGELIGLCGNSGNTTEPHLHFHLQDAPDFGSGEGKPAFFNDYLANGARVSRGEPLRGESVRNAPGGER